MVRIAVLVMTLFVVACAPKSHVWYSEDQALRLALQDAADGLCVATDGRYCPAYTDDPGAATGWVVVRSTVWCGYVDRPDRIVIDPGARDGTRCGYELQLKGEDPAPASDHMSRVLLLAHELGHYAGWQHTDRRGAIMRLWPGVRKVPWVVPPYRPWIVPAYQGQP